MVQIEHRAPSRVKSAAVRTAARMPRAIEFMAWLLIAAMLLASAGHARAQDPVPSLVLPATASDNARYATTIRRPDPGVVRQRPIGVDVAATDAYGEVKEGLSQRVPKKHFGNQRLAPGMQVVLKDVEVANAEKGKAYSEKLLDKAIANYPADEQPPGAWWVPARHGGGRVPVRERRHRDGRLHLCRAAVVLQPRGVGHRLHVLAGAVPDRDPRHRGGNRSGRGAYRRDHRAVPYTGASTHTRSVRRVRTVHGRARRDRP